MGRVMDFSIPGKQKMGHVRSIFLFSAEILPSCPTNLLWLHLLLEITFHKLFEARPKLILVTFTLKNTFGIDSLKFQDVISPSFFLSEICLK